MEPTGLTVLATAWLYNGHFAVVAFIILSGFSLEAARLGSSHPFSIKRFLLHRARRILPPYYAALVLSAIIGATILSKHTGSQWDISVPISPCMLVSHLLLLQDVTDFTGINYTHWSIAVEFQLYFLFPLFLLMYRKMKSFHAGLITFLVVITLAAVFKDVVPVAYIFLILFFEVGMLAADAVLRKGLTDRFHIGMLPGSVIILTTLFISPTLDFDRLDRYLALLDCIIAAGVILLIIGCCIRKAPTKNVLGHDLLVSLGNASYSLYLIHAPLLALVWTVIHIYISNQIMDFMLLLPIGGIVSLLVTIPFYQVFEKPFTAHIVRRKQS